MAGAINHTDDIDVVNKKGLDAHEIPEEVRLNAIKKTASNYTWPEQKEVRDQLEWFQDQKFGLMVHWGVYNEIGSKESWPLVDRDWTKWQFPGMTNLEVKQMYAKLHKGFFPIRFDPQEWADIAYAAGFRYLCFTTKHHDGFCMWDTKTTDYKVTGPEVPWRDEPKADITKHLFNAFRDKGMGISVYYSRADFDCPYYWEEGYGLKDGAERQPSYDIDANPEKWRKFQSFVYEQLKELCTGYGKVDSLWFDGGCDGVKLGLPEMVDELRKIQPHMLGVIRGGAGICEDIVTPECIAVDTYLPVPWEVCTIMGKPEKANGDKESWGYTFDQEYMSAKEVAHLLLDTVCKGGNLALNISPQPDGRLPGKAVKELKLLAQWMNIFASAIHGTRAAAPYKSGSFAYTGAKDGKTVNAFYLYSDGEKRASTYTIPGTWNVQSVTDMRSGCKLAFEKTEASVKVTLPESLVGEEGNIADCFQIELAI